MLHLKSKNPLCGFFKMIILFWFLVQWKGCLSTALHCRVLKNKLCKLNTEEKRLSVRLRVFCIDFADIVITTVAGLWVILCSCGFLQIINLVLFYFFHHILCMSYMEASKVKISSKTQSSKNTDAKHSMILHKCTWREAFLMNVGSYCSAVVDFAAFFFFSLLQRLILSATKPLTCPWHLLF